MCCVIREENGGNNGKEEDAGYEWVCCVISAVNTGKVGYFRRKKRGILEVKMEEVGDSRRKTGGSEGF